MLLKLIECNVIPEKREAFSEGQKMWKELHNVPGFVAQIGGWSRSNYNKAYILAFWLEQNSYENFMDHVHDHLFVKTRQDETYSSIKVSLYETTKSFMLQEHMPYLALTNSFSQSDCTCSFVAKNTSNSNHVLKGFFLQDLDRVKNHTMIQLEKEWTVLKEQK